MSEINGYNDRCIIYLLSHKKDSNSDDFAVLLILKNRYPDYAVYESCIEKDLLKRGFVKPIYSEKGGFDDDGNPIPVTVKEIITTDDGKKALDFNYFPSEYKEYNEKRNLRDEKIGIDRKNKRNNTITAWMAIISLIFTVLIYMLPKGCS